MPPGGPAGVGRPWGGTDAALDEKGEGGFGHREGATRLPIPSISPRT